MSPSPRNAGRGTARGRFKLLDVPPAVWAYGFFRSAAFVVPILTGTGGFGLGLFVVLVLYVLLLRRSRGAWMALVVLDLLSLVLLVVTQQQTGAPWLLHIFTALAIAALLLPSARSWVARPRAPQPSD